MKIYCFAFRMKWVKGIKSLNTFTEVKLRQERKQKDITES